MPDSFKQMFNTKQYSLETQLTVENNWLVYVFQSLTGLSD